MRITGFVHTNFERRRVFRKVKNKGNKSVMYRYTLHT